MADEDCIRIDADVIPNRNITKLDDFACFMVQGKTYDFYRNDIGVTSPVLYRKPTLEMIRNEFHLVGKDRPETDASRIPLVNRGLHTAEMVVGIHGFFQTSDDYKRHYEHKKRRKQLDQYDFDLALKMNELCQKD